MRRFNDGRPEDIGAEKTPGGRVRLQVALDQSYVHMWDWTGTDSLDLTLVLDPETFAIEEYVWEMIKSPAANSDPCLTYREVATDGRLGVDIAVPEEIRNELTGSP